MRIVFKDTKMRMYVDGVEQPVMKLLTLNYEDVIEPNSAKYAGDSLPIKDGDYQGGRGTLEFRLEKGFGDPRDVFEKHKEGIKERLDSGRVRAVVTSINALTGAPLGARFDNMILGFTGSVGDGDPWSVSMSFECNGVTEV